MIEENNTSGEQESSEVATDVVDYFESLNWNVVPYKEYQDCLKSFLPEGYPTRSVALNLVDSKLVPYYSEKITIPSPGEAILQTPFYNYVPGVESACYTLYPKDSALTKKEQVSLYKLLCRRPPNNIKPLSQSEIATFQELMKKGSEDFKAFQDFVKAQWIQHNFPRCLEIPYEVDWYMNELWKTKAEQVLALYPSLYKTKKNIPLVLNDPNQDYAVMEFCSCLMRRGGLSRMSLPRLRKPHRLVSQFDMLCRIKQVNSQENIKQVTNISPPASFDPNIDDILTHENVDVVITCSGIKTILDNHLFEKSWLLPVTVKNVQQINGTNKKVVIIDKKLHPNSLSVHNKNIWHAKIAAKWSLILNSSPKLLDNILPNTARVEKKEETSTNKDVSADIISHGNDSERVIQDEILTETKSSTQVKEDKEGIESKVTSGNTNQNKLSQSPVKSSPFKFVKPTSRIKEGRELLSYEEPLDFTEVDNFGVDPGPQKNKIVLRSRGLKEQEKNLEDGEIADKLTVNLPKIMRAVIPQPVENQPKKFNTRLMYKLWKIHKSTHFNMSKFEQRSLNILVRHRVDGKLFYYTGQQSFLDEVCVSSKIEFQPEYGASTMTQSELVREYVDLFVRQNAKLVRVRSVGYTKELMLTELKTLGEIKEILMERKVGVHNIFNPLYAVLTSLIDLPVGKYMLHHTSKMGSFTELLVDSTNGINFNINNYYSSMQPCDVNVPPISIDPLTLAPIHHRSKMPPAMFKPCIATKKKVYVIPKNKKRRKKRKKAK